MALRNLYWFYSLIIDHIVPDIPQQPLIISEDIPQQSLIIPSQHSSTIKLFVEVKVEVKTNAILKELLPLKNSNISLKILHIYPFVHKYNEKSWGPWKEQQLSRKGTIHNDCNLAHDMWIFRTFILTNINHSLHM